jgi:hypothetical protein
VEDQLTKSFAGAAAIAKEYPHYASQITAGAQAAFLKGDQWAYLAGIIAVLLGAALVALRFPGRERERKLLAEYRALDENGAPAAEAASGDAAAAATR